MKIRIREEYDPKYDCRFFWAEKKVLWWWENLKYLSGSCVMANTKELCEERISAVLAEARPDKYHPYP